MLKVHVRGVHSSVKSARAAAGPQGHTFQRNENRRSSKLLFWNSEGRWGQRFSFFFFFFQLGKGVERYRTKIDRVINGSLDGCLPLIEGAQARGGTM